MPKISFDSQPFGVPADKMDAEMCRARGPCTLNAVMSFKPGIQALEQIVGFPNIQRQPPLRNRLAGDIDT